MVMLPRCVYRVGSVRRAIIIEPARVRCVCLVALRVLFRRDGFVVVPALRVGPRARSAPAIKHPAIKQRQLAGLSQGHPNTSLVGLV